LTKLKLISAVFIALLTGFWGFTISFGDVFLEYPYWVYLAVLLLSHMLLGFIIGLLSPKRWWISLIGSWGTTGVEIIKLFIGIFTMQFSLQLFVITLHIVLVPASLTFPAVTISKKITQQNLQ